MARIKLLSKARIYSLLSLFLVPSLALAMLIYEWEDADDSAFSATGTIVFADGVSFGDSINPLSDDLLEFSFSNLILSDWSMSDFAYGNFLVPQAEGVDLDPSGFAIPTGTGKKKAAKKSAGGIFTFEQGDAYLDFTIAAKAKKKAAKKGAEPSLEPYPLWSWYSDGPIEVECPPGAACKKKAAATDISGEGYWVLKSGTVPVPEPTTFLLLLAGLGAMLSVVKRVRGRL